MKYSHAICIHTTPRKYKYYYSSPSGLTIGKTYVIVNDNIDLYNLFIDIINDNGEIAMYNAGFFNLIGRKDKLKRILKDV